MTYAEATKILLDCTHQEKTSEVQMGNGVTLNVCCDCWNKHVYARREARKQQLAEHNDKLATAGIRAMQEHGANEGDEVVRFFPSMLGLGGMVVSGRIVMRRSIPYVRFDQMVDGRREMIWSKAWDKRKPSPLPVESFNHDAEHLDDDRNSHVHPALRPVINALSDMVDGR